MNDTSHDWIDLAQSRLAYWRHGQGPDVVFIHGWPLHSATFRHVVARLAPHFTCHLIDLPGTGLSECSADARYDIASHARTVREAVDRLGLTRYAIVAHDSGGLIARHVAADDARVAGLVLGNTEIPGHTPRMLKLLVGLSRLGLVRPALRALLALGPLRRSGLGFGGCFADASYVDGEFGALFVTPLRRSRALMSGQMRLLATLDASTLRGLDALHGRITAPVTLVWGEADGWFPLRLARPMLTQFAGPTRVHAIAGAKLFVHEDHAETFAAHAQQSLATWLSDAASAALQRA